MIKNYDNDRVDTEDEFVFQRNVWWRLWVGLRALMEKIAVSNKLSWVTPEIKGVEWWDEVPHKNFWKKIESMMHALGRLNFLAPTYKSSLSAMGMHTTSLLLLNPPLRKFRSNLDFRLLFVWNFGGILISGFHFFGASRPFPKFSSDAIPIFFRAWGARFFSFCSNLPLQILLLW